MGDLGEIFYADKLPQAQSFVPIPEGWYTASIKSSEIREAKSGGKYINLGFTIQGPTHAGRVIFGRINHRNPNKIAEDIGRQQLGQLMMATGLTVAQDASDFIGRELQIKVSVRPAEGMYEASNDVRAYKPISGITSATPKQAKSDTNAPPWAKK